MTVPARGQNLLVPFPQQRNSANIAKLSPIPSALETEARRSWRRSLAPFLATQALDVISSYGMRELNPMLASPDGRFGSKAATIKIGFSGAVLGIEYLVVRRWPRAGSVLSKINWGGTVLTGSIAAHNFSIR